MNDVKQAVAVEQIEVALILLQNAMRLLDQSLAPPETRAHLAAAIGQVEEHIAAGAE